MNPDILEYGLDGFGYGPNGFNLDGGGGTLNTPIAPASESIGAFVCCVGIAVILLALYVALFYRIFKKAGYNGWMGLLSLIPGFGIIICLCILAFDTWPPFKQYAAPFTAGYAPPVYQPPAPGAPMSVQQPVPGVQPPVQQQPVQQPTYPPAYAQTPEAQPAVQYPVPDVAQIPPSQFDGGERPYQ